MASPIPPNDALLLAQLAEQQRMMPPPEPLFDLAEIYRLKAPEPEPEPPTEDELEKAARDCSEAELHTLAQLGSSKTFAALAHLASLSDAVGAYRQQIAAAHDRGVRGLSFAAVDEALITLASHPGAQWAAQQVRDVEAREQSRQALEAEQERRAIVARYWGGQRFHHGIGPNGALAAVDPYTGLAHLAGSPEWETMTRTPHAEALELVARYRRHLATCGKCGGLG